MVRWCVFCQRKIGILIQDAYFLIPSERGCSPFLIPSERGCYNLSDAKCFPQRSFFSHQSSVSPTKSCFPSGASKTFVFPSGASKTFVFPSGSLVTPQCC